jgi:hypothetical protein
VVGIARSIDAVLGEMRVPDALRPTVRSASLSKLAAAKARDAKTVVGEVLDSREVKPLRLATMPFVSDRLTTWCAWPPSKISLTRSWR